MDNAGREPWDLERFVILFDEVAHLHKEWGFERTPDRIAAAEKLYVEGSASSLKEFAESWFAFERRS